MAITGYYTRYNLLSFHMRQSFPAAKRQTRDAKMCSEQYIQRSFNHMIMKYILCAICKVPFKRESAIPAQKKNTKA